MAKTREQTAELLPMRFCEAASRAGSYGDALFRSNVMEAWFSSIFSWFLSPVGLAVLAALDSSMVFFLPAAVDMAVIILTSRQPELLWLSPPLATGGSLVGSYITFTIGRKIGEKSLNHWISERRLKAVESKIKNKGAIALALPAVMPPPFPLTPFVLACGAFNVRVVPAFLTLGIARLIRFSIAAGLAAVYGARIITLLDSPVFKYAIGGFILMSVLGTAYVAFRLVRSTRRMKQRPGETSADVPAPDNAA